MFCCLTWTWVFSIQIETWLNHSILGYLCKKCFHESMLGYLKCISSVFFPGWYFNHALPNNHHDLQKHCKRWRPASRRSRRTLASGRCPAESTKSKSTSVSSPCSTTNAFNWRIQSINAADPSTKRPPRTSSASTSSLTPNSRTRTRRTRRRRSPRRKRKWKRLMRNLRLRMKKRAMNLKKRKTPRRSRGQRS